MLNVNLHRAKEMSFLIGIYDTYTYMGRLLLGTIFVSPKSLLVSLLLNFPGVRQVSLELYLEHMCSFFRENARALTYSFPSFIYFSLSFHTIFDLFSVSCRISPIFFPLHLSLCNSSTAVTGTALSKANPYDRTLLAPL